MCLVYLVLVPDQEHDVWKLQLLRYFPLLAVYYTPLQFFHISRVKNSRKTGRDKMAGNPGNILDYPLKTIFCDFPGIPATANPGSKH